MHLPQYTCRKSTFSCVLHAKTKPWLADNKTITCGHTQMSLFLCTCCSNWAVTQCSIRIEWLDESQFTFHYLCVSCHKEQSWFLFSSCLLLLDNQSQVIIDNDEKQSRFLFSSCLLLLNNHSQVIIDTDESFCQNRNWIHYVPLSESQLSWSAVLSELNSPSWNYIHK